MMDDTDTYVVLWPAVMCNNSFQAFALWVRLTAVLWVAANKQGTCRKHAASRVSPAFENAPYIE